MIHRAARLLFVATCAAAAPAPPPNLPEVIAFFGDSIAFPDADAPATIYPIYVEAWLRQQRPDGRLVVHNFSWPGEASPRAAARFAFDVAPVKPSLVIVALGMNDGLLGSTRRDSTPAMLAATGRAHRRLAREIRVLGARELLLTPSCVDYRPPEDTDVVIEYDAGNDHFLEYGDPNGQLLRAFPRYNDTLERIAAAEAAAVRGLAGVTVLDIFHPFLARQQRLKRQAADLAIVGDGLHPNAAGHLILAWELLRALAPPSPPTGITIAGEQIVTAGGASVERLQRDGEGLHLSIRFARLPLAIPPAALLALDLVPFEAEYNQYRLAIQDWPAGTTLYLYAGQRPAGVFSAGAVHAGIDLAILPAARWWLASRRLQHRALDLAIEQRTHWKDWVAAHDPARGADPHLRTVPLNATVLADGAERSAHLADDLPTGPFALDAYVADPLRDPSRRPWVLDGWEDHSAELWRAAEGQLQLSEVPRPDRSGQAVLRLVPRPDAAGRQAVATTWTPALDLSGCRTLAVELAAVAPMEDPPLPDLTLVVETAEGGVGRVAGRAVQRRGWRTVTFPLDRATWSGPRPSPAAVVRTRFEWTWTGSGANGFLLDDFRVVE